MSEIQDKTDGWGEVTPKNSLSINSVPSDWSSYTRQDKVQKLVDVIQYQIQKVRCGTFDLKKSSQVSALCLEGLMELAEFYADVESQAKNAKYITEYIEGDTATTIKKTKLDNKEKVSETELKRLSTCSDDVKQAKKTMVDREREYRKWRYVYDTLREAHVFFRNLSKS